MNPIAKTIAAAAVVGWLGGCGGGALGMMGAAGFGGTTGAAGSGGTTGVGGFAGDIGPRGGNGPGGFGGVGSGGFSGMGGKFCPSPSTPVCGSLCGNGGIDTCVVVSEPGCPPQQAAEACDGADLETGTCATAAGWGSGTLACASNCTYNDDGCSPCVPLSPFLTSCGPAPFSTVRFGLHSLAANDSEVAIAGVQYDLFIGKPSLAFARLSSDLRLLSFRTFEETPPPGVQAMTPGATAVAPLTSGWVIAACVDRGVYIKALGGAGEDLGHTTVPYYGDSSDSCGYAPVLATRPGGGPLLLWLSDKGLSMSVIAADGLSASDPQILVDAATSGPGVAAWVGNEFAIAVPITDGISEAGNALRLLSVQPDGTVRLVGDFFTGQIHGAVTMAGGADARDVRLVFDSYKPGSLDIADYNVMWWRYDAQSPVAPVVLANEVDYYGRAPAIAFGNDSVVLLSHQITSGFAVARVGPDGAVVGPIRDVAISPYGFGPPTVVRRGPELVVSFPGPKEQLYLARVQP